MLVQSDSADATLLVIEGLRHWDRPDVFVALTSAIRLRCDRRYQNALLKSLAADQPAVRQAAMETLGRLDDANLVRNLLSIAQDQSVAVGVRQAATGALGKCVQKSAAAALVMLLSSDSVVVRQAAQDSLEELTGDDLGPDPQRWQTWWQLHKDMSEEEWLIARTAYFADRSRRLRDELRQAETNILALQQTLYAKIPPGDRPAYLKKLAQNEYPEVRAQTVTWIAEVLPDAEGSDQKQLVNLLLQLSEDVAEPVQRQAVLAMEKADDPRAFERLLTILKSGTDKVRAAAARSLGRYRDSRGGPRPEASARVVAALQTALADPSMLVVRDAAESLGSLGMPEVAPMLARLLHHPSQTVREAAAHALEQMSNPVALPELCDALTDPATSDNMRFSIVGALGKIGKDGNCSERQKSDVLRRLQTVLVKDSDPGVRSRAATVIGDLGTPAELAILWQRASANEDNRVQLKAWEAMVEIMARSTDWAVVSSWDKTLTDQRQYARRLALLTEIRNRWLKVDAAKPHMDALTGALVQALLNQQKWSQAMPLALDLVKRSQNSTELETRLRWLLLAGRQGLDDHKSQEVLQMINEIQDLLPQAPNGLGSEFEVLRRRSLQLPEKP